MLTFVQTYTESSSKVLVSVIAKMWMDSLPPWMPGLIEVRLADLCHRDLISSLTVLYNVLLYPCFQSGPSPFQLCAQ